MLLFDINQLHVLVDLYMPSTLQLHECIQCGWHHHIIPGHCQQTVVVVDQAQSHHVRLQVQCILCKCTHKLLVGVLFLIMSH